MRGLYGECEMCYCGGILDEMFTVCSDMQFNASCPMPMRLIDLILQVERLAINSFLQRASISIVLNI